jgi:tetratricopeptide (TPR) repeat protein
VKQLRQIKGRCSAVNTTHNRDANRIKRAQAQDQAQAMPALHVRGSNGGSLAPLATPNDAPPEPTALAAHEYRLGHQAYSQGDAQAAYDHFWAATQSDLACPKAHRWLGRVAIELGLGSEAKQAFETLVRLQGYSAVLGQWLEYADEVSRFGLEAASQFRAGCDAQQEGQLKVASVAFGRAVAVHPSHHRAWARLGHILLDLKSYDGAVIACERALALEPRDAGSACRLRLASQHTGSRLAPAGGSLEAFVEHDGSGRVLHGRR